LKEHIEEIARERADLAACGISSFPSNEPGDPATIHGMKATLVMLAFKISKQSVGLDARLAKIRAENEKGSAERIKAINALNSDVLNQYAGPESLGFDAEGCFIEFKPIFDV
jgi:hypothetical protein